MHKILEDIESKRAWENPLAYFHKLRLIKSKSEIELMAKTCEIASDAIIDTIRKSNPRKMYKLNILTSNYYYNFVAISEHEIYARVDYECRMRGANYLAYPPVIAGGHRANIIHYINNNQIVNQNETVLMDAGVINDIFQRNYLRYLLLFQVANITVIAAT